MKIEKVTPIYDRLLIRKAKPITKSGSIHLGREQEIQLALVVSVGEGRNFDGPGSVEIQQERQTDGTYQWRAVERKVSHKKPCLVKEGDWILLGKYSGHDVELDPQDKSKKFIILREDEVLAIVKLVEGEPPPPLEGDPDPVEEEVNLDQYRTGVDPGKEEE
jgi:co-chaperonin GroES (HSP10)